MCCLCLGAANPFILNKLTANIETKVGHDMVSAKDGLYLTALFLISHLIQTVIGEQLDHFNFMVGRKNSYKLKTLVYRKYNKISSATNKTFSDGELDGIFHSECGRFDGLFERFFNIA